MNRGWHTFVAFVFIAFVALYILLAGSEEKWGPSKHTLQTIAGALDFKSDGQRLFFKDILVPDGDPNTLHKVGGYYVDSRHVYFIPWNEEAGLETLSADPATFRDIGTASIERGDCLRFFTSDKNGVYASRKKIEGADSSTFRLLETPNGEVSGFQADAQAVYAMGVRIPASLENFKVHISSEGSDSEQRFIITNNTDCDVSTTTTQ